MQEIGLKNAVASVNRQLNNQGYASLCAEPGAGKTILAPWLLSQAGYRRVIVTQPRALTAISAARFAADFHGAALGDEIGFVTGDTQNSSSNARVEYVTDGVLARRLASAPDEFDGDLLIIDECHERSLMTDACFAMFTASNSLYADSFNAKLLLMSATMNGLALPSELSSVAPVTVAGRSFPITTQYLPCDLNDYQQVTQAIITVAEAEEGATLVFVSGQRDVRGISAYLAQCTDIPVHVLHGGLSSKEQYAVAQAASSARIILSTNLAEASITIEDVGSVVDMGLVQNAYFDPVTGNSELRREAISKASASQRAGRAGRVRAGRCVRLWSKQRHATLYEQSIAPIERESIDELLLLLGHWGSMDADDYQWLAPPNQSRWARTLTRLEQFEFARGNSLTELGELAAKLPLTASLARAVLLAKDTELVTSQVLGLESKLSGGSELIRLSEPVVLNKVQTRRRQQIVRIIARRKRVGRDLNATSALVSSAPRMLAKREHGNYYRTADNQIISVSKPASSSSPDTVWLAGAWGSQQQTAARVLAISKPEFELLCKRFARLESTIIFDNDQLWQLAVERHGRFEVEQQRSVLKGDALGEYLSALEVTKVWGLLSSSQRNDFEHEAIRLALGLGLDKEACQSRLCTGLVARIGTNDSLQTLRKLSVKTILRESLDYASQQQLNASAPEQWAGPLGSAPIVYASYDNEVVAKVSLRLQWVFGLSEVVLLGVSPNQVELTFELLSPAQRPIQTTRDLGRFWIGSYQAVRKEMRARYPKHHWPEDPANETPMRMTRRR
ncbi:ATP-dependent helicase C-terminal domain-containing protein [Umboniibacter marinipuniceus]|uniref:ATP-dependent helicase HrpB n=1 Tax=Umboniibacter marinipuniceus TaxID=569599 RepID=A0A3M0A8K1_9GAMM|nr:ATP-dependent helicase C-terminal domain-containing protein [Umboniibacter marinipuniceus]RMA81180.1 ATP-dependent helicase HrpB [Umboniibacter marinipuniceus]